VGGGLRSYAIAGSDLIDGYGIDEMSTSGRGQVLIPWPRRAVRTWRLISRTFSFESPLAEPPLTAKLTSELGQRRDCDGD
jgi:aldose 1-epimerase